MGEERRFILTRYVETCSNKTSREKDCHVLRESVLIYILTDMSLQNGWPSQTSSNVQSNSPSAVASIDSEHVRTVSGHCVCSPSYAPGLRATIICSTADVQTLRRHLAVESVGSRTSTPISRNLGMEFMMKTVI